MDKEYDKLIQRLVDLRTKVYLIEQEDNQEKYKEELTRLKEEIRLARQDLARYKYQQLNNKEKKEGR